MELAPVTVYSSEMEAAFTASSRRVTRTFFIGQIYEAEFFRVSECPWVIQMRACVEKIDARLEEPQQHQAHPAPPALRLLTH